MLCHLLEELYGEEIAAPVHRARSPQKDDPENVNYECLYMSDVETKVNGWVANIAETLSLPPSQAKLILLLNQWNIERIKADYKANADEFLVKNGIKPRGAKSHGVKRKGAFLFIFFIYKS